MDVTASRQAYADAWLRVRVDALRDEQGQASSYTVVEGADIALVVAVDGDRLHLVEQYRHPVGGRRWELPSGSIDPADADPAAAAARELREETGLYGGTLRLIGEVDVLPSTLTHRCSVFLATGLRRGEPDREPSEADLRSAWFPRAEVDRMIRTGTIRDARTLAAYALLSAL